MTTTQQQDHRFAQEHWCMKAAKELRRLGAENQDLRARVQELGEMARENRSKRVIELERRITEMEEQMAAIGAGGVEPLRKRAEAAQQAVQAAVPQIDWESAAEKIAIEVADNCGTVPNLTHPHIYLGLKKLFASHPTQQVMDAQTIKHVSALSELVRTPNAEYFADAHNAAVRHLRALAAQAKKGEAQQ